MLHEKGVTSKKDNMSKVQHSRKTWKSKTWIVGHKNSALKWKPDKEWIADGTLYTSVTEWSDGR